MIELGIIVNILTLILVVLIFLEVKKRPEAKKPRKAKEPEVLEKQTSKVYSLKKDLDAKMKGKIVDPFD